MSGGCLESLSTVCGEFLRNLDGIWTDIDDVWKISGVYLEIAWRMSREGLEIVWKVPRESLEEVWSVSREFLEDVRKVSRVGLGCLEGVSGDCLESAFRIAGLFLEVVWKKVGARMM